MFLNLTNQQFKNLSHVIIILLILYKINRIETFLYIKKKDKIFVGDLVFNSMRSID